MNYQEAVKQIYGMEEALDQRAISASRNAMRRERGRHRHPYKLMDISRGHSAAAESNFHAAAHGDLTPSEKTRHLRLGAFHNHFAAHYMNLARKLSAGG